MSDKDSSERGGLVRKPQVQSTMRKVEVRLRELFDLVKADYRTNGYKIEILNVNLKHLEPLADRSAARLEFMEFEHYRLDREKEGASPSTIQLELNTIRRAYTLGLANNYIKTAPKVPRYSKKVLDRTIRKGFFEHDQYEKQLTACKPYQRACLEFAYFCGWRQADVFNLTWKENYIENPPHIRIFDSKNGEGRVLPLLDEHDRPAKLYWLIQERLAERVGDCPYIFHYQGRKLNRSTFNEHWRAACKESGVTRYFHDLRRTANRNMKNNGVDQQDRMAIVGHKTISMDLRYGITNEHDIKVAMGKVFKGFERLNKRKEKNTPESCVSTTIPETEVNQGIIEGVESKGTISDPLNDTPRRQVGLVKSLKSFMNLFALKGKK